MESFVWVGVSVTAVACALLVFGESRGNRALRVASKPVASLGFLATAVFAGAFDSAYGRWVLLALVLCFWGDVFLLSRERRGFLLGLASFLLGHGVFVAAFVVLGALNGVAASSLVVLVPVALAAGGWLWSDVPGPMRGPVLAYIAVITAMVAAAFGAASSTPEAALPIGAGAVLFFVSDLFVARDRFKVADWRNGLFGLPLYYAGTTLLALSVGR